MILEHLSDKDYQYDYLMYVNFIKSINTSLDIEDQIIATANPGFCYFFCISGKYEVKYISRHEHIINYSESEKFCYLFCKNVRYNKNMEKTIIKSKNYDYICKFYCNVEHASTKCLELLLKKKNPKHLFCIMKKKKICNKIITKEMLRTKNPRYVYQLSRVTKNKSTLSKIEDILISKKSTNYLLKMAKHTNNKKKLEEYFISTSDKDVILQAMAKMQTKTLQGLSLMY